MKTKLSKHPNKQHIDDSGANDSSTSHTFVGKFNTKLQSKCQNDQSKSDIWSDQKLTVKIYTKKLFVSNVNNPVILCLCAHNQIKRTVSRVS